MLEETPLKSRTFRRAARWLRPAAVALAAAAVVGALVVPAAPAVAAQEKGQDVGKAQQGPPSREEVDEAIRRGVQDLYDRQKDDLLWETIPFDKRQKNDKGELIGHGTGKKDGDGYSGGGQWGGLTSLAAYTLLACGEDPTEPKLARAIEGLVGAEVVGTYAVGMRAQVWLNLPPKPEYQAAMRKDWQTLGIAIQGNNDDDRDVPQNVREDDANTGTFDYLPPETRRVDLSSSQYGVLGLWAAARYGAEVPPAYWQAMENAWLKWQQSDGGWAYKGEPSDDKPTAISITTAGVASLFITQDFLHAGEGIRCNGNISNPAIDRGMAFLVEGFPYLLGKKPTPDNKTAREKVSLGSVYYTLYGVERIGVASGLKYFGDLDWYAEGARYLLEKQRNTGSWGSVEDTCFALLFLSRGRQPVFFNKLAYAQTRGDQTRLGNWNQRPRDVANLARYIAVADERELNWQTLNFQAISDGGDSVRRAVDELHDAPVTYLAGSQPLMFSDPEKVALKQYVQEGGLLFANADCGSRPFAKSFIDLGEEMFADSGYEFRVLPDSHPIYTDQKFNLSQMRRKPKLMGLSNGVRELMVLVQGEDLGREWQLFNQNAEEAFQVGTNVYLYAVDKEQQDFKGQGHVVRANPAAEPGKKIKLARLTYDGNADPEPAGWDRLAAILLNEEKIGLTIEPVKAGESLDGYDVAHLTGTEAFEFDDAQRQAVKAFVEGGGTLIVDAAGGSSVFAASAEKMLQAAFPDKAGELTSVLPADHAVYKAAGEAVGEVDYRLAAIAVVGSERNPRLRGIAVDGGRLGVIVSNEDLSNGLVGAPVGGVIGYVPDDATRLMQSAVLYAVE